MVKKTNQKTEELKYGEKKLAKNGGTKSTSLIKSQSINLDRLST